MEYKRFRIPNRDVKLTEFEASITRTHSFQRLFYLKQLGLVHYVYPCATHTRAGHSIECLDEANNILESIGVSYKDECWTEVRMAALLHDIGHIPFSHTLEDENVVFDRHDKADRILKVLNKLKSEVVPETRDIIQKAEPIILSISSNKEEDRDWRSDLVGNTVCADLLAYIKTDAAWTGIEKRPGYYRIYDYFKKSEKLMSNGVKKTRLSILLTKGGLRSDIVSAILDLLDMRYALTERVIFHHAKAIASAMLARVARLVELNNDNEILDMGDEGFFDYLKKRADEHTNVVNGKAAKMIMEHLSSRNLYKRIFKVQRADMDTWDRSKGKNDHDKFCSRWRNGQNVENLLSKVEDRFDLPRGSLVLWCPDIESGMKLVKVNVVWDQSGGELHQPVELRSEDVKKQFPRVHERVQAIENQYFDLWTFWIGIHPEYIKNAPGVVAALSSELEIECDPVFLETYAKKRLPGFAESADIQNIIDGTWQKEIMPETTSMVLKMAARQGSQVNKSVITEAIHAVSNKKKSGKKVDRSKNNKQTDLFNEQE